MAHYVVTYSKTTYYTLDVEADSEEEAMDIAEGTDPDEFEMTIDEPEWYFIEVYEDD